MRQADLFATPMHHLPSPALEDLRQAVGYFAAHGIPFTVESLRDRLSDSTRQILRLPEHRNALGGFMMQLAKRHAVRPDGFVEAQRDAARGRPIRRWIAI